MCRPSLDHEDPLLTHPIQIYLPLPLSYINIPVIIFYLGLPYNISQ